MGARRPPDSRCVSRSSGRGPRALEHGTTLLLGLDGVAVQRVELAEDGTRVVHVATADESAAACPSCGVFSTSVKQQVTTRPKDLRYGSAPVLLRWHKRRWRCREAGCARRRSPRRSTRCRWGRAPRRDCGWRVRTRSRRTAVWMRWRGRIGCPGRRCSGRSMPARSSSWASRRRPACWASTKPDLADRGGSATGRGGSGD
jgi:zinc-finger of transposase IS204/IS1001/IS1096/IS1165